MCNLISIILIQQQKTVQDTVDDVEEEIRSQVAAYRSATLGLLRIYRKHREFEAIETLIEVNQIFVGLAADWT